MRTVAVADIEVTVRGKRDISGDKINRTLTVGDIFSWIAVSPQCLAVRRCFDDLALVDIAVIKHFPALLATETESMGATAKFFAKRTHKAASRVINHDSLSPHAGLVDGVRHVNKSLFILRKAVRIAPDQAVGRHQPIMHRFIYMRFGADHGQSTARLVRCLEKMWKGRHNRGLRAFL